MIKSNGKAAKEDDNDARRPSQASRERSRSFPRRSTWPHACNAFESKGDFVRYVDARSTTTNELLSLDDGNSIVVLVNCLEAVDMRSWLADFHSILGHTSFAYRHMRQEGLALDRASLHQIWTELLPLSCHENYIHMMDENVCQAHPLGQQILEALPPYLRDDYFKHFPEALRPAALCLIIGGAGARSDLHADPFSWTGWNYLLEGCKVWRFYPNTPQNTDVAFQSRRVPFGIPDPRDAACEPHQFCAIAGSWKSDVDVFAVRCAEQCLGPDFERQPSAAQATLPMQYVQKPGELLLFPGHWWHQVYHTSRTLGLAGQLLNDLNVRRVLEHIIEWCQLPLPPEDFWSASAQETIQTVLGDAIDAM